MQLRKSGKIGRNSLCSCGSNKKYKKCCLIKEAEEIKKQKEISEAVNKVMVQKNKE